LSGSFSFYETIMSNIKHLLTLATAAMALLGAGASMAQSYGDGESFREHAEFRNWKGAKHWRPAGTLAARETVGFNRLRFGSRYGPGPQMAAA
jgi:hypothetical protein